MKKFDENQEEDDNDDDDEEKEASMMKGVNISNDNDQDGDGEEEGSRGNKAKVRSQFMQRYFWFILNNLVLVIWSFICRAKSCGLQSG